MKEKRDAIIEETRRAERELKELLQKGPDVESQLEEDISLPEDDEEELPVEASKEQVEAQPALVEEDRTTPVQQPHEQL